MNQSEFMLLVEQMRNAQKEYFKTRDRMVLLKSKELEKKVDEQIAVIKVNEQPTVDAVTGVCCKYCIYRWNPMKCPVVELQDNTNDYDYCSKGVMRK